MLPVVPCLPLQPSANSRHTPCTDVATSPASRCQNRTSRKDQVHRSKCAHMYVTPHMRTILLCIRRLPICNFFGLSPHMYTRSPHMHTGISLWCVINLSSSHALNQNFVHAYVHTHTSKIITTLHYFDCITPHLNKCHSWIQMTILMTEFWLMTDTARTTQITGTN